MVQTISQEAISELIKLSRYKLEYSFGGMVRNLSVEKDRILRMYPELKEKRGIFVTIYKDKELRGCIGFSNSIYPLIEGVVKAAELAAFEDPRFQPLTKEELNYIHFEVSILTIPEEISNIGFDKNEIVKKIKIGKDGLIIEMNNHSGLLLPQVAKEWNFDALDFLQETCVKAGLPKTAWMNKDCHIFKFQAEIFKEVSKGKMIGV